MTGDTIRELARACGFELAGVTRALPADDANLYHSWTDAGYAAGMRYLTDHRGDVRNDPRNLLPSARSIVCVGKLYNTPWPHSTRFSDPELAWISRYAWGEDYHDVLRTGLERLEAAIGERAAGPFESRICVDTAPLLERTYARLAGLGWIGKNTCLVNQQSGSWFFLGELLLSLEIPPEAPPPDRCGTCRRCIEACPTDAIVPLNGAYTIDSGLCISYFTIESREPPPEEQREATGAHIFGCDICQDVCPWNRRAPFTAEPAFQPTRFAPDLKRLAELTEGEFKSMFKGTPIARPRYTGFLRNVAIAMGNAPREKFRAPLERLAMCDDPLVAEPAQWALEKVNRESQGS